MYQSMDLHCCEWLQHFFGHLPYPFSRHFLCVFHVLFQLNQVQICLFISSGKFDMKYEKKTWKAIEIKLKDIH